MLSNPIAAARERGVQPSLSIESASRSCRWSRQTTTPLCPRSAANTNGVALKAFLESAWISTRSGKAFITVLCPSSAARANARNSHPPLYFGEAGPQYRCAPMSLLGQEEFFHISSFNSPPEHNSPKVALPVEDYRDLRQGQRCVVMVIHCIDVQTRFCDESSRNLLHRCRSITSPGYEDVG